MFKIPLSCLMFTALNVCGLLLFFKYFLFYTPYMEHLADEIMRTQKRQKIVMVTGGAGFVGSHLVDRLMQEGHFVVVVDNLDTGRIENVQQHMGKRNFLMKKHDVVFPIHIKELDEVYHLASPASPVSYMNNSIKTIRTNVIGTENILELCKRTGAKFLLASTSEVYGDPLEHPQTETYLGNVNTVGPRACYDEGKRLAETLAYAYTNEQGVDARVARIFNTYGPRMRVADGRVISNFVIQSLKGNPITVHGSGNQTRSFQYVSDLVEGLVKMMDYPFPEPINLGNPSEISINALAVRIRNLVGADSLIIHLPGSQDDPQRRQPDISRAKNKLGWSPKVSLEVGLNRTIEYFRAELNISD